MEQSDPTTAKGIWRESHSRAVKQTLALVRLDDISKVGLTVGTPLVAIALIWAVTGELVFTALGVLAAALLISLLIYLTKLLSGPAEIAASAMREAEKGKADAEEMESLRRRELINRLTNLFLLQKSEQAPPAVRANLQLPPMDWLNENLAEQGERWQIIETNGTNFKTIELKIIHWQFDGVRLKSERTVHWAAFFDELGIKWEPPDTFSKSDPDFWLPELDCGFLAVKEHSHAASESANRIAKGSDRRIIIAAGIPRHGEQDLMLISRNSKPASGLSWMEDRRDRGIFWLADSDFNHAFCLGGPGVKTDHDRFPIVTAKIARAIDVAFAVKPHYVAQPLG